jgi:hypothetical protein
MGSIPSQGKILQIKNVSNVDPLENNNSSLFQAGANEG